ncbi:MAG: L,D-transpeptidase family protein [bacterium]
MKWIAFAIVAGSLAVAGYAQWPLAAMPSDARADMVTVLKSERKLILLKDGFVIREYRVALGHNPVGAKTQKGDGRTPEGTYVIDYRKPDSSFHRALHISYPNAADRAQAGARGVDPGGLIMIHGIRNGLGIIGRWHRLIDWTNGCIALTNAEIEQVWDAVPDGTPVEIRA